MKAKEQGVSVSKKRYQLIPRTLVFIFRGQSVLLLKGAPDKKIWANLYNGIGGHVERGETLSAAALREIAEETGLTITNLQFCGQINIDAGDEALGIGIFVFRADYAGGTLVESHEGTLEWVSLNALDNHALVSDIPVLLNQITTHETPFFGRYWYEDDRLQIEIDGQRLTPHH